MELKNNVKALNYTRKLLMQETDGVLPFPIRAQKPAPSGKQPLRLPRSTPQAAGVQPGALDELLRELAQAAHGWPHGCLVARGGNVICEGWWAPYSGQYWHVTHSLCKSFTGTAIGMLMDEGKLDLDEHICDIFSDRCSLLTSRRMRAVTVRHLLGMTSGVAFKENGAVIERDWVRGFLEADVAFEPGSVFDYNSMNTYMLSSIVRRKSGLGLTEYLTPRLFEPLGFGDVAWEKCPMGTEKGGWGMYVYLEDALKLGMVYLNGGVWKDPDGTEKPIVSRRWIDLATKAYVKRENGEEYGYQLWPCSEDGAFMFNGMFGQYVLVVPPLDLVVAVNAGAGNLFTHSESYQALRRFVKNVKAGTPDAQDGAQRLAYTLSHLRYGAPVPPMEPAVPAPALSWSQRLLSALRGKPRAAEAPAAPAPFLSLDGRRYILDRNKSGLMPLMIACMNDWYTTGTAEVGFSVRDAALWVDWNESGETLHFPVGFARAAECELQWGGNVFAAAVQGVWTQDEDGVPVLKLCINLLESSSTRSVKFFFVPDGTLTVEMEETPGLRLAMDMLADSGSSALGPRADLFRDLDYLQYRIDKVGSPVLRGAPPESAQKLLPHPMMP